MYYICPPYCECSSGVEHHLAKVRVVGSNPITRSTSSFHEEDFYWITPSPGGGIGRHVGLKIQWTVMSVRVQVPPWVLKRLKFSSVFFCFFKLLKTKTAPIYGCCFSLRDQNKLFEYSKYFRK